MQKLRRTVSADVYDRIKESILSLELSPGEEIKINEISEKLGLSRSPVRDALIRLSEEALVDILPQRGCWVSLIDLERVEEERFLRHSLEKSTLSYFIDASKDSDIARLEYYVSLQKEALLENDRVKFFSYDDAMHKSIFETANKNRIWSIIAKETGHYRRMRLLSFDEKGVLDKNIEQHVLLIEALRKKDLNDALSIEKEHIFKLTFEKGEIIKNHPTFFKKV